MATTADITMRRALESRNLGPCELVCGRLVMLPHTPWREGLIASRLLGHLSGFVRKGRVGSSGWRENWIPDRPRSRYGSSADAGFIRDERAPRVRTRGDFLGPPDLAVEVVSPTTAPANCWRRCKIGSPPGAGRFGSSIQLRRRSRSIGVAKTTLLTVDDELTDEEILPGFRLPVSEMF